MTFLEELLAGGPDYKVTIDLGGAVIRPKDDSDEGLEAFQKVYDLIRSNEGAGFEIYQTHKTSDRSHDYVDRVLINIRGIPSGTV